MLWQFEVVCDWVDLLNDTVWSCVSMWQFPAARHASAGWCRVTLARAHMLHDITCWLMSSDIEGHQYFPLISSSVHSIPGCPDAGEEWAHVMSLLQNLCGNMIRERIRNLSVKVPFNAIHPACLRYDFLRFTGFCLTWVYPWKCISLCIFGSRSVSYGEIESGEKERPTSLA